MLAACDRHDARSSEHLSDHAEKTGAGMWTTPCRKMLRDARAEHDERGRIQPPPAQKNRVDGAQWDVVRRILIPNEYDTEVTRDTPERHRRGDRVERKDR